ncbi:hypothetical protein [Microvirga sp. 2TAF3]|uniref:hypothetical protein n=1 Tax=Microvirga sp. 2TAF3 TaxID=3233014 RepID=UPI003F9EAB91
MALTGRYNFRRSLTGRLVLQVEYEARAFWSYFTGRNTYKRRWRNANVMDLAAPELRTLVDLRYRPRFMPQPTHDWPMASRPLEAIPPRSIQYRPEGDDEENPITH